MRVVVKVGTSTLAHPTGKLNVQRTRAMCEVLADLKNAGHEIILVTSGAIGMGVGKLGLTSRPEDIPTKQAAASVGQCELMYTYDRIFAEYSHTVAQILVTASDFSHGDRHDNFVNTVTRLLQLGVLPIINENDTIATDEIRFGDNDTLSAHVAAYMKADLLVILTDIDGLYTGNPKTDSQAKKIDVVEDITDEILALAGGKGSSLGTGGMVTKLHAAQICTAAGCDMIIADGKAPKALYDALDGKKVGTKFVARG